MLKRPYLILILSILTSSLHAQEDQLTIENFSFLTGFWSGSGLGGQSEEMWMPPSDGRMFGVFKQSDANGLIFTEFLEITQVDGLFILRLKHFGPDFTGWEEKDDYLTFNLSSAAGNRVEFGSLRYELIDPDHLVIELDMRQSNDTIKTELFKLTKTETKD